MAARLSRRFTRSLRRLAAKPGRFWRALRRLSGDDAYECYLAHHAACHPGAPPLSPQEYFVRQQQQKWSGIKRCC
jgi:uncharacterized short protein YbdD (DUF466 family)